MQLSLWLCAAAVVVAGVTLVQKTAASPRGGEGGGGARGGGNRGGGGAGFGGGGDVDTPRGGRGGNDRNGGGAGFGGGGDVDTPRGGRGGNNRNGGGAGFGGGGDVDTPRGGRGDRWGGHGGGWHGGRRGERRHRGRGGRGRTRKDVKTDSCTNVDGEIVETKICSASGDPHYSTFDGKNFDFQGLCCYTMIKVCDPAPDLPDIMVTVCNDKNNKPDNSVTWTRSVSVHWNDTIFKFNRTEKFWVDGVVQASANFRSNGVSVSSESGNRGTVYSLLTDSCHFSMVWDGYHHVKLYLSEAYSSRVCGLCGDMNFNANDDFANNGQTYTDVTAFGDSYLFESADNVNPSEECKTPPAPDCGADLRAKFDAPEYCKLLNYFYTDSPFVQLISAQEDESMMDALNTAFENCIYDHCAENGEDADWVKKAVTCPALQEMELEAAELTNEVVARNWRTIANCVVTCDTEPNAESSFAKSPCENTCDLQDNEAECPTDAIALPGCVCKEGFIRDGLFGHCIPVEECEKHCYDVSIHPNGTGDDSDFMNIPNGQSMSVPNCARKTCINGTMVDSGSDCSPDADCLKEKCICKEGFVGDGKTCTKAARECRPGWKSLGLMCYKLITGRMTWKKAAATCSKSRSHLAPIDSMEEQNALRELMTGGRHGSAWVAGNAQNDEDEESAQSCHFVDGAGEQGITPRCRMRKSAICRYDNSQEQPEEPEENMCERMERTKRSTPCPGEQQCIPTGNWYTCECPKGYILNHQRKCTRECGHCRLTGDPHFLNLNGDRFDFQGKCKYLFNGICPDAVIPDGILRYEVETIFVPCSDDKPVTCLNSLTVKFLDVPITATVRKDFVITKDRSSTHYMVGTEQKYGTFIVNNEEGEELISVRFSGKELEVKAKGDLKVQTRGGSVTVFPPPDLRSEMCGLCGQCLQTVMYRNGSSGALPKSGKKIIPSAAADFADTWLVLDPTASAEECKGAPEEPCDPDTLQKANDACAPIKDPNGDFQSCHGTVDPEAFFSNCVYDFCRDSVADICKNMKDYADECSTKEKPLSWRKPDRCPLTCDSSKNLEYSNNANCQPQCGESMVSNCVRKQHSDGCRCVKGFYEQGELCVPESECGCEYMDYTTTTFLMPNETMLNEGCSKTVTCRPGGIIEETEYVMDANAMCVSGVSSTVQCAKGFELMADGHKCQRNTKECDESRGFSIVGGVCVDAPADPQTWRHALEKCNMLNSTLMHVDVFNKLSGLKDFMKTKTIKMAFIGGLVRLYPSSTNRSHEPVLTKTQQGLIEYINFAAPNFVLDKLKLPSTLDMDLLPETGATFAIAVTYDNEVDEVSLIAVDRRDKIKFFCEERSGDPSTYVPTPYCNKNHETNGEIERVLELMQDPDCKMCPVPSSVTCRPASGTSLTNPPGDCGFNNGILYTCTGNDCVDMEVSGNCPRDVNECLEKDLHDCNDDQICVNTEGSYLCRCPSDKLNMVDNVCKGLDRCVMSGTQDRPNSFDLQLTPFSASSAGLLNSQCQMYFATVCKADDALPYFQIVVNNVKKERKAYQDVMVVVRKPGETTNSTFEFTQDLRQQGNYQVNGQLRVGVFTKDPTSGLVISPVGSDGSYLLTDNNSLFKILIRAGAHGILKSLSLELSDDFNKDNICGLCKMDKADRYSVTDASFSREVPAGSTRCEPIQQPTSKPPTPPPASPTNPLVITKPPAEPSTPLPPSENCQSQTSFCEVMTQFCDINYVDCFNHTCNGRLPECQYMSTISFYQCSSSITTQAMTLDDFIFETCRKDCTEKEMLTRWPLTSRRPSCLDQDFEFPKENGAVGKTFVCMCDRDKGFFQEDGKCIHRSECGCTTPDGEYWPEGSTWSNRDCTMEYECQNKAVSGKDVSCTQGAICDNGKCQCEGAKGKGQPTMPDGCTGTDRGNETCYLVGTPNEACYCNEGFASSCEGCEDINECALDSHLCKDRQRCKNTPGSYTCVCKQGYRLNGDQCDDIDECKEFDNPCPGKGTRCINNVGTFSCQCCAGYDMIAGICERNFTRVPVMPDNPPCCQCNKTICIISSTAISNGCYQNSQGLHKDYAEYRILHEQYCLKGKTVNTARWSFGPCPDDAPMVPTTQSPEEEEDDESDEEPAEECTPDNVCKAVPVPANLKNGVKLCGPLGTDQKTYSTYCNMLLHMCEKAGGPSKFKPLTPPQAMPGPCPTQAPTSTVPPLSTVELNFSLWQTWSACSLDEEDKDGGCGTGTRYRQRSLVDLNPPRQALASELEQATLCHISCVSTPNPTTSPSDEKTTPSCPSIEMCTQTSKVCASIGEDDPRTYSSLCVLEVYACYRKQPMVVHYSGECDSGDVHPKKYCEEPLLEKRMNKTLPSLPGCKAEVLADNCLERLCENSNSLYCCMPDGFKQKEVIFACDNNKFYTREIPVPASCKCELRISDSIP